jgi:Zn-dependent protease with chaperone function
MLLSFANAASDASTSSLWDKLLPAIAAGVAGILAALIGAGVALASHRRAFRQSRETQSSQLAVALLPRRLDAFEQLWIALYRIQRGNGLSESEADAVVGATVWVPADIRDNMARLLGSPDSEALIAEVRRNLLKASGADEIDVAIARLRER